MRTLNYIVTAKDEGRAVRSVVPQRFCLGVHAFRRLKAQGGILVCGEVSRADRILHAGDEIRLLLPDIGEAAGDAPADEPALAALPRSFIRYRDEDLLIVSKGAPLATLPDAHSRSGTLREQLAAMLGLRADAFVYHPVNRLDKGTSGLLCVALHAHAQRLLAAQLHTDDFEREYLAITEGVPPPCGVIDAPIARAGQGARRCVREDGQRSRTQFCVEDAHAGRALVRLRLQTGRTHQIRVHLSSIGCPVVGDYLYGHEVSELAGRFALHSCRLVLTQPVTGERICIEEPMPRQLLDLLG